MRQTLKAGLPIFMALIVFYLSIFAISSIFPMTPADISYAAPLSAPGPQNFFVEAARGNVLNNSVILKFGVNTDIDTAAAEDIWDGGGVWVAPTQGRLHTITSTNATDASDSTGARTMTIQGLDENGALQEETVSLSGTNIVTTTGQYLIIYRMFVVTAGSGAGNNGNIDAKAITDNTLTARISITKNQTLMAITQVPTNTEACILSFYANTNKRTGNNDADVSLLVKEQNQVFQTKNTQGLLGDSTARFQHYYLAPFCVPAMSIIKMQSEVGSNDTGISAGFDYILKDAN